MARRIDIAILIGILGSGAVVAVPRQVQLAREWRSAEVAALARNATTAAQLAHLRWLAAGKPATIDGLRGVVAMNHGYPSTATLPLMLGEPESQPFRYEGGVWQYAAVPARRPCGVVYQPPAVPGQNPAISAQTSGC